MIYEVVQCNSEICYAMYTVIIVECNTQMSSLIPIYWAGLRRCKDSIFPSLLGLVVTETLLQKLYHIVKLWSANNYSPSKRAAVRQHARGCYYKFQTIQHHAFGLLLLIIACFMAFLREVEECLLKNWEINSVFLSL